MIGNAIYALLSTAPEVAAIVGMRIYPHVAPQGAAQPYVVYSIISEAVTTGAAGDCGLDRTTAQVSCFGSDYGQVVVLNSNIRKVLNGFTGTAGGVKIAYCQHAGGREMYEEDAQLYHRATDYRFQIRNT